MSLLHLPYRLTACAICCLAFGLLLASPSRAQAQQVPPPGIPLPDLEQLFPPGTVDAEQLKMLKKLLEGNQADLQKMMEDPQKMVPGGFPGGGAGMPNIRMPGMGGFVGGRENRLGAVLQQPSQTLVDQLGLPERQGIVLTTVKPGSAAARGGLKTSDIVLELDGKLVPSSVDGFIKQLNAIKRDTPVDAVVLRKGQKETIKGIKLGDVPAGGNPFGGFGPGMPNFKIQPGVMLPGAAPGSGTQMSTARGPGGAFTTRYQEGTIAITVQGKLENGKANVASIEIREGEQTRTYKSVQEVPEDLREDVRVLIRHAESGNTFSFKKLGG